MAFGQQNYTVAQIDITGNKSVTREAILARMKTKVGGPYSQSQLDVDKNNILQMGFFKAVDANATPMGAGDQWKVSITVQEFAVIKEFRIIGNSVIPTDQIAKKITLRVGQPFNISEQKPTADAIEQLYRSKGYLGRVEELQPLEDSPSTVSITIHETKVHSVAVQGGRRTKPFVFKHLIKTKPGQAYNERQWADDIRNLYNTQWFDKIDHSERPSEDGRDVDLLIGVTEARTGNVRFGLTLDPHNSFAGDVQVADTNFMGTGQSLGLDYLQTIRGGGPSVDLRYVNPFIDSHDTTLSVDLYSRLIYRFTGNVLGGTDFSGLSQAYTERRTGGAVVVSRPVGYRTTLDTGIKFESVKTNDVKDEQGQFLQEDGTIGTGTLGLTYNRRDYDLDPAAGWWYNVTAEPGFANITEVGGPLANPNLLGKGTFFRATSELRAYWSPQKPRGNNVDAPRNVFATRLKYGHLSGKVPFFEQFFAGGSDTVRGYDEDRFWGDQLLTATLEFRHPIQKSFNVIAFIDYGGAWGGFGSINSFTQSNKIKLHLGYGPGVSFKTPFGPIRLDLGFNEKGKTRTHFLIGTSF